MEIRRKGVNGIVDWWMVAGLAVVIAACVLALFWALCFVASVQNLVFYKDDGMKEREN